ncbi:MAG: EAL domain-containing protein [Hyphomonadaceae bacterium]|nr:EAL domain-containing protein [Hyphomonadaceae bacterium]
MFGGEHIGQHVRGAASRTLRLFRARAGFILAAFVLAGAYAGDLTNGFDNRLFAWRSKALERAPTESVVVVEIDSRSVRAAGQWPWPRQRYAQAIRNLRDAGAELIAFDVDFSALSAPEDDRALASAIGDDPSTIVLPTFIQGGDLAENTPLASLSRDALVASVNIPIDADGVARRYALGYGHGAHFHPAVAAVLANARYGDESTFLVDYSIDESAVPRLSFHDVFRGTFDPELVRGRQVLIGATALELGDEFATPARAGMPGVYIHALAYESIAQGRMLVRLSQGLVLLIALGVLVLLWPKRAPLDVRRMMLTHAGVAAFLVLAPLALQALLPVTVDVGIVLLAQALCIVAAVQTELAHRAFELGRQREAHLSYIAFHDPETDLPNRRAMLDAIGGALNTANDRAVVAITVGIDRFPVLRAAIGYANANALVRELAQRLSAKSGSPVHHLSTSIVGLVIAADCADTARNMCEACLTQLDKTIDIGGSEVDIAIRIGAAASTGAENASAETLLEQAAVAIDLARMRNRRYVMFDAHDMPDPKVQLALVSDIGRGLARDEFALLYQPKRCTRTGAIVGAEALMRWTHPVHGPISPDRFIGAAEDTGAIHDLTLWAINRAVADQMELQSQGRSMRLSINISARSLIDPGFCGIVIDAIREAGADICFEITETAIIDDPLAAISAITAFRDAGIKVSIDDYGSGLSSLGYLKQIAADELKIDKSLIADLTNSPRDRLILKSTIDLAHGLGMSVVIEGVEDEATLALVTALGCDIVQGYLISRPLPLQGLEEIGVDHATRRAAHA